MFALAIQSNLTKSSELSTVEQGSNICIRDSQYAVAWKSYWSIDETTSTSYKFRYKARASSEGTYLVVSENRCPDARFLYRPPRNHDAQMNWPATSCTSLTIFLKITNCGETQVLPSYRKPIINSII